MAWRTESLAGSLPHESRAQLGGNARAHGRPGIRKKTGSFLTSGERMCPMNRAAWPSTDRTADLNVGRPQPITRRQAKPSHLDDRSRPAQFEV
jgi:hypothetical protein